jgi:glycosyltransferase involved in cell wall biosynthesis
MSTGIEAGRSGVLRVIFVTGSLCRGGAERHAVNLMNRLSERENECHAVYIQKRADRPADLLDRIRLRGRGTVHCLNAVRYFDMRALADFAAYISGIRPSVILAENSYALMYSWIALRLARLQVPLVVTYHSTRLPTAKEKLQMAVYRLFFWTADCSVFVCESQRRYCLRRGIFSRRNEMIYNGVDICEFCDKGNPEERDTVRKAFGFCDTDYVIGIAALMRPEKNHVQLVDAVAALRNMGIPARALIVGDGEMRGAVETRARRLKVENSIVITGVQRDVRPYVAACDAVAVCSLTEGFPFAVIEAMALGKPVVQSEVGGAAEWIVPGANGFLFPAGDTGALVDKLAILADRALSRSIGARAREMVELRFSEDIMVDRYAHLLTQLCRTPVSAGEAGVI